MRLKRMVLTAGTLALLVVAVAAIAPDFGGTVAHAQAPTPTVVVVPTAVPLPPPVTRVEQEMRSVGADSAAMRTPIPIVDRLRNAPQRDLRVEKATCVFAARAGRVEALSRSATDSGRDSGR